MCVEVLVGPGAPPLESSHLVSQMGLNIGCQRHAGHTWVFFCTLGGNWHWTGLSSTCSSSTGSTGTTFLSPQFTLGRLPFFPDSWSYTFVSACEKSRRSSGPAPQPARVSTVLSPLSSSGSVFVYVRDTQSVCVCRTHTHFYGKYSVFIDIIFCAAANCPYHL